MRQAHGDESAPSFGVALEGYRMGRHRGERINGLAPDSARVQGTRPQNRNANSRARDGGGGMRDVEEVQTGSARREGERRVGGLRHDSCSMPIISGLPYVSRASSNSQFFALELQ